jgi:hypothetical protein
LRGCHEAEQQLHQAGCVQDMFEGGDPTRAHITVPGPVQFSESLEELGNPHTRWSRVWRRSSQSIQHEVIEGAGARREGAEVIFLEYAQLRRVVLPFERSVNFRIELCNRRDEVSYRQPSGLTETRKPIELESHDLRL